MFIFVLCSSQTVELDKQLNKNRKIHHSASLYTWQIMSKISFSFHSFSVFGLQAGFTPLTSQPVLYRVVSVRRESKWWSVMSCDLLWILSILVSTLMLKSVGQRLCFNVHQVFVHDIFGWSHQGKHVQQIQPLSLLCAL